MPQAESAETVSAEEVRKLAVRLGCRTQADLADALGISQPRVSQILTGRHPVKRGPLLRLIRQLQRAASRTA